MAAAASLGTPVALLAEEPSMAPTNEVKRMNNFAFYILTTLAVFATVQANAESLFYEKCPGQVSLLSKDGDSAVIVMVSTQSGFAGMSCEDLKSTFEAAQIIGMSLLPASAILQTPGVREEIAAELAGLGLTLANPAILGVTVLGTVGLVTVRFVMKASLKECESRQREDFKQEILREIKNKYPGVTGHNVPLEIQEGDAA